MSATSTLPWAAAAPSAAKSGAIALYARWSPELDVMQHDVGLLQSSSLGVEDMVVTDLIHRAGLRIDVATLDTGKLHPETLALLPRIRSRYGLEVQVFQPVAGAVIAFVQREGEDAMRRSIALRKACCGLRKLEPLGRMLAGRSAWITGLRREQSGARAEVAFDADDATPDNPGRRKLNPLADWSWADVWHYIVERFDVPYNPLHDQFMPQHRLRALHARHRARRGLPRRALVVGGQRQRMRPALHAQSGDAAA
jgi:phosphoadenosine phosphosulfate reductase